VIFYMNTLISDLSQSVDVGDIHKLTKLSIGPVQWKKSFDISD